MAAAILITGANRGLGFEFARQYVADGWRVFAACRNPAFPALCLTAPAASLAMPLILSVVLLMIGLLTN